MNAAHNKWLTSDTGGWEYKKKLGLLGIFEGWAHFLTDSEIV